MQPGSVFNVVECSTSTLVLLYFYYIPDRRLYFRLHYCWLVYVTELKTQNKTWCVVRDEYFYWRWGPEYFITAPLTHSCHHDLLEVVINQNSSSLTAGAAAWREDAALSLQCRQTEAETVRQTFIVTSLNSSCVSRCCPVVLHVSRRRCEVW